MRLVLVTEDAAGVEMLKALRATDHSLLAVVAPDADKEGTPARSARRLGETVLPPSELSTAGFAEQLRRQQVDLILNVHSKTLFPESLLEVPRLGCFNLHPGPLPGLAGLNVISWALYLGRTLHGVTLHWMTPRIDAGPIVFQSSFSIQEEETALELYQRCVEAGTPLVMRLLEAAERGTPIPRHPQELERRRYYPGAAPDHARIDFQQPAHRVLNLVRACDYAPFSSPWGQAWAQRGQEKVRLLKAEPTGLASDAPPGSVRLGPGDGLEVACQDRWLRVRRAEPELFAGDQLS